MINELKDKQKYTLIHKKNYPRLGIHFKITKKSVRGSNYCNHKYESNW